MANNDFVLQVIATIIGVGAASGLFYRNDSVYLISDDSNYLYRYSLSADTLDRRPLLDGDAAYERLPKKQKRDFEALAFDGDRFHIYGSGSSNSGKRNLQITIGIDERLPDTARDLTSLYARLQALAGIGEDDFNIEGVAYHEGTLYLFNRGNGPRSMNGVFRLDTAARDTAFFPIELPELGNTPAAFTDAVVVGDQIYFLAAAENADSVYDDGAIQGSLFGSLTLPRLDLQAYTVLSSTHKFEGLTFVGQDAERLTFFLCEDPDNGSAETTLFKLTIPSY